MFGFHYISEFQKIAKLTYRTQFPMNSNDKYKESQSGGFSVCQNFIKDLKFEKTDLKKTIF